METTNTICPVCTLYLREGINLRTHLETHPKEQVIEALLNYSNASSSVPQSQASATSSSSSSSSSSSLLSSSSPNESSQIPMQSIGNAPSSFISAPYVAPQAQMTTAVTYQQFMTSNGSTVIPQYIQVPAIVNPNGSIPVISNQTLNYIPNQTVSYSPTIYNPLYNPYIPQPYPFPQPAYTNVPTSALPAGEPNIASNAGAVNTGTNLETSHQEEESSTEASVVQVNKCTVVTSTSTEKRTAKVCKKSLSKYRKKVKKRVFKSRLGEPSSSSVIQSTVKNPSVYAKKTYGPARKTVALQTANVASSLPILPPAPLTLITKPFANTNLNSVTPPPPPPLSKAPCTVPQSVTVVKREDLAECKRPKSTPAIITTVDINHCERPQLISSVIVESNSLVQSNTNDEQTCHEIVNAGEEEVSIIEKSSESVIIRKENEIVSGTYRFRGNNDITITKVTTPTEQYKEGPEGEEEEDTHRRENHLRDREENENLEKSEKFFDIIEVVEECKANITTGNLNDETPKELGFESTEDSYCTNAFNPEETVLPSESTESHGEKNSDEESLGNRGESGDLVETNNRGFVEERKNETSRENICDSRDFSDRTFESPSAEERIVIETPAQKQSDLQTVTYTDLQPATSPRVFGDLALPPTFNLSGYMEVEGIKIIISNTTTTTVPLDPSLKVTTIQTNSTDLPGLFQSGNSSGNQAMMDSVIQLVSGNSEPKTTFTFGENLSATTSQGQEGHLDLPDLSPFALNIQADESMPARGELSEQESLGAENSTWSLFRSSSAANNAKTLDDWRSLESSQQGSTLEKQTLGKTFKCSVCNQVFSCPKERRVHKNIVHPKEADKKRVAPKKPKTYSCSFCNAIYTTLRDRKIHVLEMHLEESKAKKKSNQIKEETAEAETANTNIASPPIKVEEGSDSNVKTEEIMASVTSTIITPPVATETATTASSTTLSTTEVEAQRVKYCSQCSLPFAGVKKLRQHLRIVHGEIRFKCDTCSQIFDDDSEYNVHLLIHPLSCEKCGKKFHKRPNLNLHMKRHLEVKPYECTLCPKSFITRQKLEEHMNGHSGKKPLKCPHCDKTFSRHSNLIQHRNLHHLNVKKKIKDFVCRCGEIFHSLRKLEWHKEVHDPKPKSCPFCTQKFIHSASVTRHIRRAHLPDYLPGDNREYDNVQCPICEKIYLRSSLVVHMRSHNGEKPFSCKICNKSFSTKWNLEIHNWTHQSRSNMPFKCHICKGAFFREPDFVAHLNAHRNYKPFTCNICGQKFVRKYSCLRHQEEHQKSKQFVCGVNGCAKSFHRSYYLRDHMRVHTGVRPHTCHICGKASSTKSNHNKHVRIHDTREPVNTEN